jgi:hypothetical protein
VIGKKSNWKKLQYLINNQLNIKWWNWKKKQEGEKIWNVMGKNEKKKEARRPGLLGRPRVLRSLEKGSSAWAWSSLPV